MPYDICVLHKLNEGQSALVCPAGIKGQRVEKNTMGRPPQPSKTYHIPSSCQPNRKVDMHAFPQNILHSYNRAGGYTPQTSPSPV